MEPLVKLVTWAPVPQTEVNIRKYHEPKNHQTRSTPTLRGRRRLGTTGERSAKPSCAAPAGRQRGATPARAWRFWSEWAGAWRRPAGAARGSSADGAGDAAGAVVEQSGDGADTQRDQRPAEEDG